MGHVGKCWIYASSKYHRSLELIKAACLKRKEIQEKEITR